MHRILVVEDDTEIASQVKRQLGKNGFVADVTADGLTAMELGQDRCYAAIVLDLGLPRLDGLSVLRQLRGQGVDTPVIVLTARSTWTERVDGINTGADDYLPKPFRFEELLARLQAVLRRSQKRDADGMQQIGDIRINRQGRTLTKCGKDLVLTSLEFRLFEVFASSPGQVIKTDDLIASVYGLENAKCTATFDRLLARLRSKIGTGLILSHRGLGYKLVVEP